MKINGYVIKDVAEELQEKLTNTRELLESQNMYYKSEGKKTQKELDSTINCYVELQRSIELLSAVQTYYNATVTYTHGSETVPLQVLIKRLGSAKAARDMWLKLANSQQQERKPSRYSLYDSRTRDSEKEYPSYVYKEHECRQMAELDAGKMRSLKRAIRDANSVEIELPSLLEKAEYLFS